MAAIVDRCLRYVSRIGFVDRVLKRARFPGLRIGAGTNLDIRGTFSYGAGCGIGEGTNIIIPREATLLLGEDCYIGRYVELGPGGRVEIGGDTSIQDRSIFLGDVTVGRHCLISLNVLMSSGRHYFDLEPWFLIRDQDSRVVQDKNLSKNKLIVVEDDCWLGMNVVVMPGVSIRKGAVIGASSVVTKDVEPYTVVAGAPAKVLRKRLDFVPPRSIAYNNPRDWPYFYSGFEVSKKCLDQYAQFGGIAARTQFSVCLDASSWNSIHVVVKSIDSSVHTLVFGDQRNAISDQFQEVVFTNNEHSTRSSLFRMRGDPGDGLLIVQKAWVQ